MISFTCSLASMTVTVMKERYIEILQKFFLEDSHNNSSESVFMIDGGPAHTSFDDGNEVVEGSLSEKLISLESEFI